MGVYITYFGNSNYNKFLLRRKEMSIRGILEEYVKDYQVDKALSEIKQSLIEEMNKFETTYQAESDLLVKVIKAIEDICK